MKKIDIDKTDKTEFTSSKQIENTSSKQTDNREKKILRTSIIGIIVNIGLAITKIILGTITNSIAITSDAMNNLTDSSSSIITIVGTKLSSKRKMKNTPLVMVGLNTLLVWL